MISRYQTQCFSIIIVIFLYYIRNVFDVTYFRKKIQVPRGKNVSYTVDFAYLSHLVFSFSQKSNYYLDKTLNEKSQKMFQERN